MHIRYLGLPSNQFTLSFKKIYTLLCVAMVTMLAKDILQNVWLREVDCN